MQKVIKLISTIVTITTILCFTFVKISLFGILGIFVFCLVLANDYKK